MYISIIGKAGSGKTTLFSALSGMASPTSGGSHGIVSIDVPDERLDYLTSVFNPKKTVHARVELSDTVAIDEGDLKNETINQKSLQQLRSSDAFLLVLRNFDNGESVSTLAISEPSTLNLSSQIWHKSRVALNAWRNNP